ncbi:MAG: ribosome biogenesis GTP-binding protein YihA/YsxC [Rickettsiales bacterium]|nr:ribosome biogenesis GTP-binding protein YihA/YsxC [Rickettsiales bacterium]
MIRFMGAFDSAKDLPRHPSVREYAFAGRSNVGKSSLINALAGEKIAKVSNTPGRTRTLNLFNWDDRIWLMDLPGYGYARVSKADQVAWLRRLEDYLSSRAELKKLFILIDSRVGAKDADEIIIDFCKSENIPFQIVYTKCDKRGSGFVVRGSCGVVTSAVKKTGIDEVRKLMK